MPIIDFSEDDVNRGRIITPAWYRVRIDTVREAPSKAGDSTNWILDGRVMYNADNGDKTFANLPTPYWNFNSKAKGFMVGFFESLGAEVKPGVRLELKNAEGKEIDVFIENDMYNGQLVNRINHKYRKPRTESSAA